MARKLQSDKWLFLATLALICASIVMVYSASALVALERFQQPYLFVSRQMLNPPRPTMSATSKIPAPEMTRLVCLSAKRVIVPPACSKPIQKKMLKRQRMMITVMRSLSLFSEPQQTAAAKKAA